MGDDEAKETYPLSRDELLKYVEVDLWSKFQGRLWTVVGGVLTLVAVVGLLGVPYYIKSQVELQLAQRTREFQLRSEEVMSHAKLLAMESARYQAERLRLDADIYRLLNALRDQASDKKNHLASFSPDEALVQLVSSMDFSKTVEGSLSTMQLWSIPKDMRGKRLLEPTMYTVENPGLHGAGMYSEIHPVRDGTYGGCINDIKYRIVVIEALRRSIAASEKKLLELGGVDENEKRYQVVRFSSLESSEYNESLDKEIASIAAKFLSPEEKKQFEDARKLYTYDLRLTGQ